MSGTQYLIAELARITIDPIDSARALSFIKQT